MSVDQARRFARNYSSKYCTFWYVREVKPGVFQPYAHDSGDAATVAAFYCGRIYSA